MRTNESSGQETTDDAPTKTERRAEWEGFEFRVPTEGAVRVENVSYGDDSDEHVYVVSVENGIPFDCTCPAWEYHNPEGGCKHMVAVEQHPAVTHAASTASTATTRQQVATDGGHVENDDEPTTTGTDAECPECQEGTLTHEPQPGSDTIPTFVCGNCGYSTFTPSQ